MNLNQQRESRLKPVCVYYNPDCKICVDKEVKRVDTLMPRAGQCNKCIEPLVGSKHCQGLEMGCACKCGEDIFKFMVID